MIVRLLAALVVAFLAVPPSAVAEEASAPVKTVAIISALGDTAAKKTVGLTVFDNADASEDIQDWRIDEFVIAEFKAQIEPRYKVVNVPYAKRDFFPDTGGIIVDADLDAEACIAKLSLPQGMEKPDAYIIVTKAFFDDVITRTNQHFFGLGFYHPNVRGPYARSIYAAYEVNVVDGRTGKRMTDRYPSGVFDFGVTPDYRRMTYDLVYNLWGDGFVLSAEQHKEAAEKMKPLVKRMVAATLKDFKFVDNDAP